MVNSELKEINILVLSDFTVEHFLDWSLKNAFLKENKRLNIVFGQINNYNFFEKNYKSLNFDYIIVWLNLYSMLDITDLSKEQVFDFVLRGYNYIKKNFKSKVLWIGIDTIEQLENRIYGNIAYMNDMRTIINNQIIKNISQDDVFIYLDRIIAHIGCDKAYNMKYKYKWDCIYKKELFEQLAEEILKQYKVDHGERIKCIVLDCDNVLWGGILSEDGIANLKLGNMGGGKIYKDFQKYMLMLYRHGILLAIVSKNDSMDVNYVFENHNEMILKQEHITCFQVNWNTKTHNLLIISETLNISLNNILFIDDSQFEINLVNRILPEVKTILFKPYEFYKELNVFNLSAKVDLEMVEKRNQTYKINVMRKELRKNMDSYDEYLTYINTKMDIHEAKESEIRRISELSLRTNKMTNGNRLTVNDIKKMMESNDFKVYSVYVSDIFGDLGLVGAIILYDNREVQLICLSCRAMGRGIENKMIDEILLNSSNIDLLERDTGKNAEFIKLLADKFYNCI